MKRSDLILLIISIIAILSLTFLYFYWTYIIQPQQEQKSNKTITQYILPILECTSTCQKNGGEMNQCGNKCSKEITGNLTSEEKIKLYKEIESLKKTGNALYPAQ